jgi:phenylpropionate dioxygenase-like ring-hydroxylating dioxygenase large terminal subunit
MNPYIDKDIFEFEKELFGEYWILAAHKNELKENNDFVTIKYFDKSIFIQNYNGVLKCYENICLHRFNNIHSEDCGNRSSTCLYHHWLYNENGRVSGIKCVDSFENSDKIKQMKLREFELACCGDFVFVNLSKNTTSLRSFLGEFYDEIDKFSNNFSFKITDYFKPHSANWKILIENVLECYHCSSVHQNTFAKMGYGFSTPKTINLYDGHSYCEFPKSVNVKQNKVLENVLKNRSFKTEGYLHYFIFPNTFISTVEGKGFYFGTLNPLKLDQTDLRVRYFSSKFEDVQSDNDLNLINIFNESSIKSLDLILDEDKYILENIQKNIHRRPELEPIFGKEEYRIIEFYKFYFQHLNYLNNERSI